MFEFYYTDNKKQGKQFIRQCYDVKKQLNILSFHTLFSVHYDYNYSSTCENHNFWECVYVINGDITSTIGEKIYTLTTNDIIFLKPFALHNLKIDSQNGADILIFSFTESSSFMLFFENKLFKLSPFQSNIFNSLMDFLHSNYVEKRKYSNPTLKNYLDCFNISETFSHTVSSYIQLLFLQLYEQPNQLILSNSTAPKAELFKNAVNFMNTNISNSLSVTQIAKHCHTSSSNLKQVFHEYTKSGIHKYFLSLKITAATELLSNGESVNNVSEILGFSSPAYFSSVYKRETGISPSNLHFKK